MPLVETVRNLSGQTEDQREANFTPYRVIADHARAAAFLIADGVVPGNTGRNYVCRMIIRRASRFGGKLGLNDPFLAKVAETVILYYGETYPELKRNRATILANLTREEERFHRTLEEGVSVLNGYLVELKANNETILNGKQAFDLYATHGLPLEIARDIAREQGLDVDEKGFREAMDEHRQISGAGKAFGTMGGEDVEFYRTILDDLVTEGKLSAQGVSYDPYTRTNTEVKILAFFRDGISITEAHPGEQVNIILPETCLYIEAGGQVSDSGTLSRKDPEKWLIEIDEASKPAAGVIIHSGRVVKGNPQVGDFAILAVDIQRRQNIMRNHTATHLLHAHLQHVLGDHARQAGSLVAPDRLRFDFTHNDAVTHDQLELIEAGVNNDILDNYQLNITVKPLAQAIEEGATALFGEKYGEIVRTIAIGDKGEISYELCGGTHVSKTSDIGLFLITSEGSTAAGIRRIEAVTGRGAYEYVRLRFSTLKQTAGLLSSSIDETPAKAKILLDELDITAKHLANLRQELVSERFDQQLQKVSQINDVPVLTGILSGANVDTLRVMADRFRQVYPSGVVVLGSNNDDKPMIIAAVTDDLVKRGLNAGELVKSIAQVIGGSGGGRPSLAQAGGKDGSRLEEALAQVEVYVRQKLK